MKKYLKLYTILVRLNLHIIFLDRETLLNNLISSTLWGLFPLLSIALLTAKTKTFYDWTTDELYLLTGCFVFFLGLFLTIFGRSFKRFAVLSQFGYLDETLLKPVDSQFLISFWHINFANLFRIIIGMYLIVTSILKLHIVITPILLLTFFVSLLFGIVLLYSIWFMVLTLTVWFPKLSNLRDLLITFNSMTRYPPETFQSLFFFIFLFFLPLTLIVSTPTKTLLNETSMIYFGLLGIISITFFGLSRLFWNYSLRYYTSAGG